MVVSLLVLATPTMGAPPNWVFDPAAASVELPVLFEPLAFVAAVPVDESVAWVWLGFVPVVRLPVGCEFWLNRELELLPKPVFPPKVEGCPKPPELAMPETGVAPAMAPPAMPFKESLAS